MSDRADDLGTVRIDEEDRIAARRVQENGVPKGLSDGEIVLLFAQHRTRAINGAQTRGVGFAEGKKIYDQGWNDGIDQLHKILSATIGARFSR
jgi:hypothetical protein